MFTARSCLCHDFCEMYFPASTGCLSVLELSIAFLCFLAKVPAPLLLCTEDTEAQICICDDTSSKIPLPLHQLSNMFSSALKCCMLSRRYPGNSPVLSGAANESELNYILGRWMAQVICLQALALASMRALHRLSRE